MHDLRARDRGRPILLDVSNDEFCARCMRHKWARGRLIHDISEVAHENAMNSSLLHLANAKTAIEDAHVGVYAHVEERINSALTQDVVYFPSTVGNYITRSNGQ